MNRAWSHPHLPTATPALADTAIASLLAQARTKILWASILRNSLDFFAIACLQAMILIGLCVWLQDGVAFWTGLFLLGMWPWMARVGKWIKRDNFHHMEPLVDESRSTFWTLFPRKLWMTRFAVLFSALFVAVLELVPGQSAPGLIACGVPIIFLFASIWSDMGISPQRVAWLLDQQSGLDGGLSLWLDFFLEKETSTNSHAFAGLVRQSVQTHMEILRHVVKSPWARLSPAGYHRSVPSPASIAVAGFCAMGLGFTSLLAQNFWNAQRQPTVLQARGNMAIRATMPRTAPHPLVISSTLVHQLPPRLAKMILQHQSTSSQIMPSISVQHAKVVAQAMSRDIKRRTTWQRNLKKIAAMLRPAAASPTAQNSGGTSASASGNTGPTPTAVPNQQKKASLVHSLDDAGLSAMAQSHILTAASGTGSRKGTAQSLALRAALQDVRLTDMSLTRQLAAEKKILHEISRYISLSANHGKSVRGYKLATSTNPVLPSALPHGISQGLNHGGPSGMQPLEIRSNMHHSSTGTHINGLVDADSLAVFDQPARAAAKPGASTSDSLPHNLASPSVSQATRHSTLPAGYAAIIHNYFRR